MNETRGNPASRTSTRRSRAFSTVRMSSCLLVTCTKSVPVRRARQTALMTSLGPRVVVAGTRSGSGKTTIATGVMAALRARSERVAPAKVGPDFIDPGYHSAATGRPARNLDAWISGAGAIVPLAARAATAVDILVVEGVMGLFDGAAEPEAGSEAEPGDDASTA